MEVVICRSHGQWAPSQRKEKNAWYDKFSYLERLSRYTQVVGSTRGPPRRVVILTGYGSRSLEMGIEINTTEKRRLVRLPKHFFDVHVYYVSGTFTRPGA